MNITLGFGKKVHSAARGLGTPDCLNWGHKGSERYRATNLEVTCARCLKKKAAKVEAPVEEAPVPAPVAAPVKADRYAKSFPAMTGETVTQGHTDYCAAKGHATYTLNGTEQDTCPRCGKPHNGDTSASRAWNGEPETCPDGDHHARALPGETLETCTVCGADLPLPIPLPIDSLPEVSPWWSFGAPLPQQNSLHTTFEVVQYCGDTELESGTIVALTRLGAAQKFTSGKGLFLGFRRLDGETPGATRWTLTDKDGLGVGSLTVR